MVKNDMVKNVTDNNFDSELCCENKIVVDFWATWCQPCKMLSPIIEELDKECTGVKFLKVNANESPSLASRYKITSLPTILVFHNGTIEVIKGFKPKAIIKEIIESI